MSRVPNCFDLFQVFSYGVQCVGGTVSDDALAHAWRAFCDEHRATHRNRSRCLRGVTKAQPINVRELALVKSCKRKVRW